MNTASKVMTFGVGGRRRSWKREALWISGTTGVGTLIGALSGGRKGAAVGAATSGAARFILSLVAR